MRGQNPEFDILEIQNPEFNFFEGQISELNRKPKCWTQELEGQNPELNIFECQNPEFKILKSQLKSWIRDFIKPSWILDFGTQKSQI